MKNSLTNESDYLNALIKTAEYLATLITYQDFWVYIKKLIKEYYNVDLVYFYECGYDGKIFKLQKDFSNNQFSEKIFEQIKELLAQVMDSGFIVSELINIPELYAIVLLPITKMKKIIGIMVIGHQRNELLPKYLLNIYLSLARLVSTTIDNLYMIEELKNHQNHLEELVKDREKAAEALRESEEKYRDLYQEAPNAYFSIGTDRLILHSNMAASKLLGYTKEEFLNMDVFNLYHDSENGLEKAKTTFQQFLRGDNIVDQEVIMRHKNGSPIWISLSVSPIKDQNDQIIQSRSMAVDITDRKKAEEKIKYQAKLVDSISDAIISTDLDFNIISWNKAAERIYGWKSDEVIGNPVAEILNTEYINQNRNKVLKSLRKKGHWSGEVIQQRKSHQKVNVFSTLSLIRDIKENPIGVVAINRDITELRKSKQEVKKLESTLHEMNALIETAPLAIFLLDPSGKILRANEEAKNLFNFDDEILNFNILDLFDSDYLKLAKKHFNDDIYNLSVPNKIEASIKSKTGKIIDVEVTSTIIKIVDNLIIQSFFSEISERKNYERNRELLLDELNASLEFKSKFLANVSHELRTPLNAILGFSQLLLEQSYGKINPEQKEFMKDINSAGNHLLRIINSILDLSRIEAGKLIMRPEKVNLNKLIKKIDMIIHPLYTKKGIEFNIEGITDNDYLFADSLHFKQVLFNLLSNSIKFTEKGIITLRVIEKLDHWEFQVEDTGIGIAAENYDIIFREFGRIEDDRTNETPGVGLGLALTKRLINLHGGEIWFESELNKKTTFYFTIPKNPSLS